MFVTYPDVLQPGRGGLRAGWPLALIAASGAAVSHAIPPEYVAGLYYFVSLSHSCLGIACGFGVGRDCGCGGGAHRGCGYGRGCGCGWGRVEGVAGGASGVWLGDAWGADLVWMWCG